MKTGEINNGANKWWRDRLDFIRINSLSVFQVDSSQNGLYPMSPSSGISDSTMSNFDGESFFSIVSYSILFIYFIYVMM